MRGYERHMKAAHEESGDEQQVTAMPESPADRLAGRQCRLPRAPLPTSAFQGHGERGNDNHRTGQQEERGLPAVVREERLPERGKHELPERTRGGGETHGLRAPVLRNQPAQRGDDDGERGARETEADEHTGREVEGQRRRAYGHERDTSGVDDATGGEYAGRAVAVGHGPGERLSHAPHDVLYRYRKGEHLGRPATPLADRRREQPKARPQPVGDKRDQTPTPHHKRRRPPPPRPASYQTRTSSLKKLVSTTACQLFVLARRRIRTLRKVDASARHSNLTGANIDASERLVNHEGGE